MPGRKLARKVDRHLSLRLDSALLTRLQAQAKKEMRSMNAQILVDLREALAMWDEGDVAARGGR